MILTFYYLHNPQQFKTFASLSLQVLSRQLTPRRNTLINWQLHLEEQNQISILYSFALLRSACTYMTVTLVSSKISPSQFHLENSFLSCATCFGVSAPFTLGELVAVVAADEAVWSSSFTTFTPFT